MAPVRSFGNDPAKIAGYLAFWERAPVRRPLVGFSIKSWFPLQEFSASAAWQRCEVLTPEMVEPEAFLDDQERLLREGEVIEDDILRGPRRRRPCRGWTACSGPRCGSCPAPFWASSGPWRGMTWRTSTWTRGLPGSPST